MAFNYVTSIQPGGVALYVEDAVAGAPLDLTPVIGSFAIVALAGSVNVYLKTSATAWKLILRDPLDLAIAIQNAVSGTIGGSLVMPILLTASGGGGTQAVTLPGRTGDWRVRDFYIVNTSGGGGAGSVKCQKAAGAADITDALVPGAADAITRAATLIYANALVSGSGVGVLNFVKAAGFTASMGWVSFDPSL